MMRTLLAGALLTLCLNAVAAVPAAKANHPPRPPSCNCAVTLPAVVPDTRGTTQSPLAVSVVRLPPAEKPPEDQNAKKTADATFALAVLTFVVALATGVLAFFTWRLWKSTRDLVVEGRETAKRELRAYVATSEVIREPLSGTQAPRVKVVIKNFGRTPAYRFAMRAEAEIAFRPEHLTNITAPGQVLGVLPPGAEYSTILVAVLGIGKSNFVEFDSAATSLFVHGRINYADSFGAVHYTQFCLRDNGATGEPKKFFLCDIGNDTDDQTIVSD